MDFKLGDVVRHKHSRDLATIVAIDTRDAFAVMLGWKEGQNYPLGAYPSRDVSLLATDRAIPNWRQNYHYVYWETISNVEPAELKLFSKVRHKTLRKRMRDQLAQEALSIKE